MQVIDIVKPKCSHHAATLKKLPFPDGSRLHYTICQLCKRSIYKTDASLENAVATQEEEFIDSYTAGRKTLTCF